MGDWSFAGGVKANPELYSRYEVLERLGEGTYGEVYKGKRKLDGLIVALKETRDPQCATREAEALLALHHPNVVKLIEYFVQGANLILVLEFLPLDLYRIVEGSNGRIPEAQVKGWMLQILRGVAACHQANILHRDLKPSNLLVGADGSVKIADFGQARVVPQQSADLLGINDTIFERDEVRTTHNMEKEEIDAWISGAPFAKSTVKESTEMKAAGPSEGLQQPPITVADYEVGQCFCVTNDKEDFQGRSDDQNGTGDTVGCRSLNCSMVKREGLIVARSNHFVEIEQKMETVKSAHDEELGRREWVLAEKNMVNSEQEKDGDFFCKLRSFLKRRGRKPQKHFRWGRDKSDTESSQMIMEEEGGRLDYLDQELDTAVLQESAHDFISGERPSPFSGMTSTTDKTGMRIDSTLSKEIEVGKSEVEHMDNVGLRPLMGTGSTEEEIVFSGNGLFFDDGSCPVDQVPGYYAFGDSEPEDSDQEEGDMTCQTRWYGPPDVRDSYVKGKLEVHEESSQNEDVDDYSREVYGHFNDDERLHDSEVHSQQEETESTYSSESGNKGSGLSPFVGTRWYKGPELLYGATKYGKALDIWAVGCIFAQLLTGKPLFPGITDIDQLSRIVRVLGAPNENNWPGVSQLPDFDKISFSDDRDLLSLRKLLPQASPSALKFLEKFLVLDPERRISAEAALKDAYFLEDPLPVISHDLKMPSFRRDSSASEDWGEWRDPGSPFSDFEILDSAP